MPAATCFGCLLASLHEVRAEEGEVDGARSLGVVQIKGDVCHGLAVDLEAAEGPPRSSPIKNNYIVYYRSWYDNIIIYCINNII